MISCPVCGGQELTGATADGRCFGMGRCANCGTPLKSALLRKFCEEKGIPVKELGLEVMPPGVPAPKSGIAHEAATSSDPEEEL